MKPRYWQFLADVVFALHCGWLLLAIRGAWFWALEVKAPLPLRKFDFEHWAMMFVVYAGPLSWMLFRGRCLFTELEFYLRRRGGDTTRYRGLLTRAWRWARHGRDAA